MSGPRKKKRSRALRSLSRELDQSSEPEPEPEPEPVLVSYSLVNSTQRNFLDNQRQSSPEPEPEPLVHWMPSSWQSKRARVHPGSSRQHGPVCTNELQDTDFPHIQFRDSEQFTRFQCLKVRRILPTRFLSDECITALGIKSDLEWLFDRVGWNGLMMNQYLTFQELTLEFLSSFQQKIVRVPKGHLSGVWFRLFNQEFYRSLDEFGDFFGLPRGGNVLFYDSDPSLVWRQLTGCSLYNPQSAKASRIHNPVFRYLQRIMANTIFGRHDSQGTVREWEMEMIQSMLYPNVQLCTAAYIARHFYSVGKSKRKSPIVIGGLITPIAASLGFDIDQYQAVSPIPTIDIPKLVNMGWLYEDGDRYRWVVNKKPTFYLPNIEKTTIRNQANWVFAESFVSDGEEERNGGNYERGYQNNSATSLQQEGDVGGSSSQPSQLPSSQPNDFASLLSSLNSIHTGIQDILASQQYLNQRMDQFDRMLCPIYNWHVQQGHIDSNTIPYHDLQIPQPTYRPPSPPGI